MPLFRKLTDEEFIAKFKIDQRKLLETNYDMLDGQGDYPEKSYLLNPDSIYARSYEKLGNDKVEFILAIKEPGVDM